jgi:hypothetical protein
VTPTSGPIAGGTSVTVTGSNFVTGATVTIGGTAATNVSVVNATTITATTPAHAAGAVGVVVTNPDAQSGTLANGFTYLGPVPAVTSVTPNSGPFGGGTSVTVSGSNFVAGATVTFGGTAATNVSVVNATTITATTPAHAAGAVSVVVTNPDTQSGTLANGFTYLGAAPGVTGVTPNNGPIAGGTNVTVSGSNFVTGATVTIGGTAATSVTVVNATTITATTPAHAAGAVAVVVTNPDAQSGTLANGFTYLGPAPGVTSVTPSSGPIAGGTSITVSGSNFVTGATMTIGGTAATNVTVVNATTITATTPAHAAGVVSVVVRNPDTQTGTLANGFTYLGPAPGVTSVTPTSGPIGGGTNVTVSGSNFVTGATVTFGGTAATNVSVVNATTITATTPAHAAGAVSVVVRNPDTQTGTLANGFTYLGPAPGVTSVTPNVGPIGGGTNVTVSGSNFFTGATVTFGGTAATNVTVVSATTITATTPAHAAGAVSVVVRNPDTQSGTLANGFTYELPISFVQAAAAVPQSSPTSVSVAYTSAQTAGDLNVIIVGWKDTASVVQAVQDSAGNVYNLAIGPTTGAGLRQSIYYAANIRAGANTVTVTFNRATAFPDVRILQYHGATTLDATAGASGNGNTADSGAATTTATTALIVGGSTVARRTMKAGTGFTERIITSPNGNIAEDRIVVTPGTYNATAGLSGNAAWVMQMAIFR